MQVIYVNRTRYTGELCFHCYNKRFLKEPAFFYFINVIIRTDIWFDDALQISENHFSDDHVKRVNDVVWLVLTFDLIYLKRASRNEGVAYEKIVSELLTQILQLADIRTGSGYASDVSTKLIAAVRGVEAFELVYRNLPRQI